MERQLIEAATRRCVISSTINNLVDYSRLYSYCNKRSKSGVRFALVLLGAEIFTFKVVARGWLAGSCPMCSLAYLTLSLPWLMLIALANDLPRLK